MNDNFIAQRSEPEKELLCYYILNSKLLLSCILLVVSMVVSTVSYGDNNPLTSVSTDFAHYPQGGGMRVAATFGPDGRLWRVVPEKEYIYVDYSTDLGKSFSIPVRINKKPQIIKVSRQNRPDIKVDHAGRIIVIYTAKLGHTTIQLISISENKGSSFSIPMPLSKKVSESISFLGRLVITPSGKVYAFWLDERDRTDWRKPGYSIYSAILDNKNNSKLVNNKIAKSLCECCRIAAAFDNKKSQPVLLARFIYPDNIRDHGLIRLSPEGKEPVSWRVTFDKWKIRGCPEQGPAISINKEDEYHIAWFTQGNTRKGLFYAYSSDQGTHFSDPLAFGNLDNSPGYPDVLANGKQIFLTWKEFDGTKTNILTMQSKNGGRNWLPSKSIAESTSDSDVPFFLSDSKGVFVSWNTKDKGYLLIPLGLNTNSGE